MREFVCTWTLSPKMSKCPKYFLSTYTGELWVSISGIIIMIWDGIPLDPVPKDVNTTVRLLFPSYPHRGAM